MIKILLTLKQIGLLTLFYKAHSSNVEYPTFGNDV